MNVLAPFDFMDIFRRELGFSLDALGICPRETPSRTILAKPLFNVKAYDNGTEGPILLMVPAPIKQYYLWDMLPEVSVVRQCLAGGIRPCLIQWKDPGASGQSAGLSAYADTALSEAIAAVLRHTGAEKLFLAGHSLGGTLAAIFSAAHPGQVQGLITLGAPMHFGPDAGVFAPPVSPRSGSMAPAFSGNLPGTFLTSMSYLAAPGVFGTERWLDWFMSLTDYEALKIHFCVERWSLDELPFARQLYDDVLEMLYRDDLFMRGALAVNGNEANPENIQAPVFTVADPRCPVVPPGSILPFHDKMSARGKRLLWYAGEAGVALRHAGLLVGRAAHKTIWPEIIAWIHKYGGEERRT